MTGLRSRIHRLTTSIMLLAALAFAFHTGAVAADFAALADCSGHAAAPVQSDQHAAKVHAAADAGQGGAIHVHPAHADADGAKSAALGDHKACKVPCCGAGCTLAVLALGVSLPAASIVTAHLPTPALVTLVGTELTGQKRPPRLLPLLG